MSLIVIDGMTGSGKSSLAKILAEEWRFDLFEEVFRDEDDLLAKYFMEGNRWCFPMQISFLTNRFNQYVAASAQKNIIMDRSIFSDPIFAELYYFNKDMKAEEYHVYHRLYNALVQTLKPPDLIVFLDFAAAEAIARIQRRGRPDELAVKQEYWQELHGVYTSHYQNYTSSPLLWIDVNHLDFVHDSAAREKIVHEIKQNLHGEEQ